MFVHSVLVEGTVELVVFDVVWKQGRGFVVYIITLIWQSSSWKLMRVYACAFHTCVYVFSYFFHAMSYCDWLHRAC